MQLVEAEYRLSQTCDPPEQLARRFFSGYMYRHIRDYVLYRSSKRTNERSKAKAAWAWINGAVPGHLIESDAGELLADEPVPDPVLAFDSVCEILDLSPADMRAKIKRLTKKIVMHRLQLMCDREQKASDDADDA